MKKITLALLIVFCLSSLAFATKAGRVGIEASNLIIGNPLGYLTGGKGMLFYQFTNDISAGIGLISSNDPTGSNDTDSYLGLQLKGQWNLGKGKIIPHVGAEIDYVSGDTPGGAWLTSFSFINLALTYGYEVMWLPGLSIVGDVRVLEYSSLDGTNIFDDQETDTSLSLITGTTLGIRWYIL